MKRILDILGALFLLLTGMFLILLFFNFRAKTDNPMIAILLFVFLLGLGACAIIFGIRRFWITFKGNTNKAEGSDKIYGETPAVKRAGNRFLVTFCWSLPIYFLILSFAVTKETLFDGLIASLLMSLFSGIAAMLIPVRRKIVFVSIGILAILALVLVIQGGR
ncbi:hypothetical protein [Desulfatitalea alkaliphila]|uniref:Uncharacterized protein n=1 Tax=Desulfatitalea alkaliphila TaxID=2929485 RepID=A0AA41UKL1_9BACT|nr:hypothetical protein [Desulfatitalea alkaliphila]MCJ8503205.1 hypothetical protein [Desulfatitalea alkaliphila]